MISNFRVFVINPSWFSSFGGSGLVIMAEQPSRLFIKILIGLIAGVILLLVILFRESIWQNLSYFYHLLADRDRVRDFIASFGWGAPLVFMGIQILQVIFAPVPGEATGFIGGYLFGVLKGFVYSSAALAVGSYINFSIGRFLLMPGKVQVTLFRQTGIQSVILLRPWVTV